MRVIEDMSIIIIMRLLTIKSKTTFVSTILLPLRIRAFLSHTYIMVLSYNGFIKIE